MQTKNVIALAILSFLLFGFNQCIYSQNVFFTDLELKNFLIYENSVDTNNDGLADWNINTNNDNEIQLTELLATNSLYIRGSSNNYFIKSIQDLSGFNHLKKLSLLSIDSLTELSDLNLDSLSFLWIGSCFNLKHIDISDLPAITYLRIEDIFDIDYLNLKNGCFASNTFSLFYSENIQYACVDSIAAEYNEVQQHMAIGETPSINCVNSIQLPPSNLQLNISPNPAHNTLQIKTNLLIDQVLIHSLDGKTYPCSFSSYNQSIDISFLPIGIYSLQVLSSQGLHLQTFIKQ